MYLFSNRAKKPIRLNEGDRKSYVQLLRPGSWNHPEYGKLEFTSKHFDDFVKNFNDKVRGVDLAIDQEHKPEEGAAGWIRKLENRGKDGLWALVEWTKVGVDLVKDGAYRYLSSEFDYEWEDNESGKKFENVLFGAALTNRPFIKDLSPVNLSEHTDALMKDKDIGNIIKLAENVLKLKESESRPMLKFIRVQDGLSINLSESSDITEKFKKSDVLEFKESDTVEDENSIKIEKKTDENGVTKFEDANGNEWILTEAGEDAKIKQESTGKGKKKIKKEQADAKLEKEAKANKGKQASEKTLFKDDDGTVYELVEDDEDDDEAPVYDCVCTECGKSAKGSLIPCDDLPCESCGGKMESKKKMSESNNDNDNDDGDSFIRECLECGHTEKSKYGEANKKCPECGGQMRRKERPGQGRNNGKKFDAAVMPKSLSARERDVGMRLTEVRSKDPSTAKVLTDTLADLRKARVLSEKRSIGSMLDKHFQNGKLSAAEKDTWEQVLLSEVNKTSVAVFKLSERSKRGRKAASVSLEYVLDKVLSERPVVVELQEKALSSIGERGKSKELREQEEDLSDAQRIARKHGGGHILSDGEKGKTTQK